MNKPPLPPCSIPDCTEGASIIVAEQLLCGTHSAMAYAELRTKKQNAPDSGAAPLALLGS